VNIRKRLAIALHKTLALTRHDISEEPASPAQRIAYVHLPGAEALIVARWHDGQWKDEKRQPFPSAPLCWYSVEPRA
jgi:hypothetical protein